MPLRRPPKGRAALVALSLVAIAGLASLGAGLVTKEWYIATSPQLNYFMSPFKYCEGYHCRDYPSAEIETACSTTLLSVTPKESRTASEVDLRMQLLQVMFGGAFILLLFTFLAVLAGCQRGAGRASALVATGLSLLAFLFNLVGVIMAPTTFQSWLFCGMSLCEYSQLNLYSQVVLSQCTESLGFSYGVSVVSLIFSLALLVGCMAYAGLCAGEVKDGEMHRSRTKLYDVGDLDDNPFEDAPQRRAVLKTNPIKEEVNHTSQQEEPDSHHNASDQTHRKVSDHSNHQQQQVQPQTQEQQQQQQSRGAASPMQSPRQLQSPRETNHHAQRGGGQPQEQSHSQQTTATTTTQQQQQQYQQEDSRPLPETPERALYNDAGTAGGAGGGGNVNPDSIPLPPEDGGWEFDDGSGLYWSEQEYLFLNTVNNQYYDPKSDMWYDPDQDHWYTDN